MSCSILIRVSYSTASKSNAALLIGVGAVSFIVIWTCRWLFVTYILSFLFFLQYDFTFFGVVSSDRKNSCSSSATSVDCELNCFGLVVI